MPSQVLSTVENNFTKGLVTEFTGLNFPENAATDCDNVRFDLIGNVARREAITWETDYVAEDLGQRTDDAINTYKWNNAGGDGVTQIVVAQVGEILHFYEASAATAASPLSTHLLASSVDMTDFVVEGGAFDTSLECQFTDGNGYLFVFHPNCEPIYCTYESGVITGNPITIKVRDFVGAIDDLEDNVRPSTLTNPHNYNLLNQGWTSGNPWSATSSTSVTLGVGAKVFTVAAGITGIVPAQTIIVRTVGVPNSYYMIGTVTSYVGTTLTLSITSVSGSGTFSSWSIVPVDNGYIGTWFTDVGNYPSNADQWWRFKNASGVFDPATTQPNVSLSLGPAPKGHFLLHAFNQDRESVSGISGITLVSTLNRPTHGCWFQGRIWYTGVNSSQAATSTTSFMTWTENIYFSQIVTKVEDLGKCYQTNDPTSEELFDLLPTDGGVIVIQGCGPIYRLFPIQNGMLVFAANGVWFITGNQGIGFTANDYTITKISSIQSLSTSSFVDVEGLPYFWNEDGIYSVKPQQQGGLAVTSITLSTIASFYDEIPMESKIYARAAYNPIEYTIQWLYKSVNSVSTYDRYSFDRILNYNVANKSFYPFSIAFGEISSVAINGIDYINSANQDSPAPAFKYFNSNDSAGTTFYSFADEHGTSYVDWFITGVGGDPTPYESYFVTGYKLHGQAQRRFQMPYLYMYGRNTEDVGIAYKIQGIWDYATSGDTGRYSSKETVNVFQPNYSVIIRRHRIRGRGLVLQIKVTSVDGMPFDLIGWSAFETQNTGV